MKTQEMRNREGDGRVVARLVNGAWLGTAFENRTRHAGCCEKVSDPIDEAIRSSD